MMEAAEYLKQLRRLCHTVESCEACPILKEIGGISPCIPTRYSEDDKVIVEIVEKWAEEHPDGKQKGQITCGKCRHWKPITGKIGHCGLQFFSVGTFDEDFCSRGQDRWTRKQKGEIGLWT